METKNTKLPYPFNLQADVVGNRTEGIDDPDELYLSVEYVLRSLPTRERLAIRCRYREGLTLKEISERNGCTSTERGRQIVKKAIMMLRHPSRFRYIAEGIRGEMWQRENKAYDRGFADGARNAIDKLPIAALNLSPEDCATLKAYLVDTIGQLTDLPYEKIKHCLGLKETKRIIDMLKATGGYDNSMIVWKFEKDSDFQETQPADDKKYDIPIDELYLSVRAYNCLRRGNINTVQELSAVSLQELRRLRNMGEKTIQEIVEILRARGIELPEEPPATYSQRYFPNQKNIPK